MNREQRAKTLQIVVRDNNVEQALRILKKKMQREVVFREMKRRRYYEKPSERTMDDDAKITPRQIGVHPDAHIINMVSFGI